MQQFTGSDEYWDRVIAAQLGWPQKQPPEPDPDRFRSSVNARVRAGESVPDTAGRPPGLEYEPVHGWSMRQFDGYLARNPGYRSTYEAGLQKRGCASSRGTNGPSFDWPGLRRTHHDKAAGNAEPNGAKQARESQTGALCGL
jgi:hypothetical protein